MLNTNILRAMATVSHPQVYPLGAPAMGGPRDPRTGTCCSIEDADYHLRNYVWLLSTNTIALLDPRSGTPWVGGYPLGG